MPLELEPEPEPLLPHPAASTPTAASATSATSGRRSSPDLLGGGLLVPFQTRMCVPSFAGLGPCLVVHQLLWSPCRADLPPTMSSRRPGVVVASPQPHHPAASIPAYPLAAMDAGRRRPVQAAARARGVPSTLRVTWMLPRVALAYGQRRSAGAAHVLGDRELEVQAAVGGAADPGPAAFCDRLGGVQDPGQRGDWHLAAFLCGVNDYRSLTIGGLLGPHCHLIVHRLELRSAGTGRRGPDLASPLGGWEPALPSAAPAPSVVVAAWPVAPMGWCWPGMRPRTPSTSVPSTVSRSSSSSVSRSRASRCSPSM